MSIRIRNTRVSDLPSLLSIFRRAHINMFPDDIHYNKYLKITRGYFLNWHMYVLGQRHYYISKVLLEDGIVVAYISAVEKIEHSIPLPYVHIPELFVDPKYQNKGYGSLLLSNCVKECEQTFKRSKWIDLNVSSYNTNAINIYLKSGFKIMYKIGPNKKYYTHGPDNKKYSIIRMARPLRRTRIRYYVKHPDCI